MKKLLPAVLAALLLLSSCAGPAAEVTPEPEKAYTPDPAYTWWIDPTPTPRLISTPEPTPEPTPFLSYEDYFAQTIDYGSIFDDAIDKDLYYDHVEWLYDTNPALAPVLALAQELIPDDTMGLIPETLHYVADNCLYVFWAGNEEGAYLYRFYSPTETLDLIYTIPAEEFEEKYYYTPKTEATAYFFLHLVR